MNCLKCGRETVEDHVFCDKCLQEMEKYPVRPGTALMLPKRKEESSPKKSKRHGYSAISAEEQVRSLKRQKGWLVASVGLLTLLLAVTVLLSALRYHRKVLLPGQNYSAIETMAAEPTP